MHSDDSQAGAEPSRAQLGAGASVQETLVLTGPTVFPCSASLALAPAEPGLQSTSGGGCRLGGVNAAFILQPELVLHHGPGPLPWVRPEDRPAGQMAASLQRRDLPVTPKSAKHLMASPFLGRDKDFLLSPQCSSFLPAPDKSDESISTGKKQSGSTFNLSQT